MPIFSLSALPGGDSDPEHRLRFEFPEEFIASPEHSARVIGEWTRQLEEGGPFVFAVRSNVGHTLLGGCEIRLSRGGRANLSYFTLPQHRRGGVASRAVALVCRIASSSLCVRCLEIAADIDNTGSRRVAIKNEFREIGMRDHRILYAKSLVSPNNSFESDALKTTRASS